MTATQIDPRNIAQTLGLDTYDLARAFRTWANDELDVLGRDIISDDFPEYDRVENFDACIDKVRSWLVAAVECEKAYWEDNPITEGDDA